MYSNASQRNYGRKYSTGDIYIQFSYLSHDYQHLREHVRVESKIKMEFIHIEHHMKM
jgi:hypothetical protein